MLRVSWVAMSMFSDNYNTGLSDKHFHILCESPISPRNGRGCVILPGLYNLLKLTLGRESVASRSSFRPLRVIFSGIMLPVLG